MRRVLSSLSMATLAAAVCIGCADVQKPTVKVTLVKPGPNAQKEAQEALIKAKPGEVVEFGEGKFAFDQTLSLEDVEGVTIRGKGIDKTILNFGQQLAGAGGEGIMAKSGNFTICDLTIQDTRGDGIKVEGVKGVTFREVKVEWTRGPDPENGAYAIYPVLCEDVLIEDCHVTDCSDAGVYVGQSKNVIVRRNRAERNVAGIEIENTIGADVYENVSTNNAGGMLVFSLPGLKQKVGRQCRVYDNKIFENNHKNFAKPGNIVASVPPGTGLTIMANDEVEVFQNQIRDNATANISIISFLATQVKTFEQLQKDDPEYDPFPEGIYLHDNVITGGGFKPGGDFGILITGALGNKIPNIIYDGIVDQRKLVEGKLPDNLRIYIKNNGDADFVNLDFLNLAASKQPNISTDLAAHEGELPPLPKITIPGVE